MINSFRGEYRFLSNFYPCTVLYEGVEYPSSEHAYVAAKTLDEDERKKISQIESASEAKRYGRYGLNLREDWEDVKISIMREIVLYKFTHNDELRNKLIETIPHDLEEGNTHGDMIWGTVDGIGQNHLGKILMSVRNKLLKNT